MDYRYSFTNQPKPKVEAEWQHEIYMRNAHTYEVRKTSIDNRRGR